MSVDTVNNEASKVRDLIKEVSDLVSSGFVFSDVMIEEDQPVMVKAPAGWVETPDMTPVNRTDFQHTLAKIEPNWDGLIDKQSINRPIEIGKYRLRINAYLTNGGSKLNMVIRKIDKSPKSMTELGLPQSLRLMIDSRRGIIFVNGATGSGKSTTVAALVDTINASRKAHIVTIEEPIEYVFERKMSVFSQREIGVDVDGFYEGVRDAMRQRPDVIVIGEIRDKNTADAALLAAESGVLVIGTVHANSAASAIQKMLAFFSSEERASKCQAIMSTLVGVISQALLPSENMNGWELATELIFNHHQQYSPIIDAPEKIMAALHAREDGVSQSMVQALVKLVSDKKISPADAMYALDGSQREKFHQDLKTIGK